MLIRCNNVPKSAQGYLTAGKGYKVINSDNKGEMYSLKKLGRLLRFVDDTGHILVTNELDSCHLKGGNWECSTPAD